MESILLTENIEIGKKLISKKSKNPYTTFVFFAKAGDTIRKHDNGVVDICEDIGNEIKRITPIGVGGMITIETMGQYSHLLGKIVWEKALFQKNK